MNRFEVKSTLAGFDWPAFPTAIGAQLLALQWQMQESQWWPKQTLEEHQFTQLDRLFQFARIHTPFYQSFYRDLDVKGPLTASNFRQLPILRREIIQQAKGKFVSQDLPPQYGRLMKLSSSGSTGRPIEVYKNEVNDYMSKVFTLRDHLWHNRDITRRFAAIRHSPEQAYQAPEGKRSPSWTQATAEMFVTGPSYRLDSMAPTSEQLDWLLVCQPDYLMTYPSNLRALIQQTERMGRLPSSLRQVITFGELLPPSLRAELRERWQIDLTDTYSCQEAGVLALQCPEHEHYHVQAENVLLEVLNDKDEACQVGEVGRVVLSSLHNFASPLLRYEVGDYAEVGACCDCGRGLPVLKRIYGRARNMVKYPNGDTAWPYLGGSGYFSDVVNINQFQIVQTQSDTLDMYLVMDREMTKIQQSGLTDKIRSALRYPFKLNFIYVDAIARGTTGKFEDFISKVV